MGVNSGVDSFWWFLWFVDEGIMILLVIFVMFIGFWVCVYCGYLIDFKLSLERNEGRI